MTKEYWVLYSGVGTDGGFGDYAPPYWDDDPVTAGGQVVWFATKEEAKQAEETLNDLASTAFYSVGEHDAYDGLFPVEYEVRKIVVPNSRVSTVKVVGGIADEYQSNWQDPHDCGNAYECDEDCCKEVEDS